MDLLEIYFFIFDFSKQYVMLLFFPKLRGRFTHGTVRANVFFSDNFNVFFKGRNKKAILLKDLYLLLNIQIILHMGWGQGVVKARHETMKMYVHIHKI